MLSSSPVSNDVSSALLSTTIAVVEAASATKLLMPEDAHWTKN